MAKKETVVSRAAQRVLAYFAERNGLQVKDLKAVSSKGVKGLLIEVKYGGEKPIKLGRRFYVTSDTGEMFKVPRRIPTAWAFEMIFLMDPLRLAVLRIAP